jgi:hypothetical protein
MDDMNKRTLGVRKIGRIRLSNPERKVVVISEPNAVLRVELIDLSPDEERALTTDVRIGGNEASATKSSQTARK